MAGIGSAGYGGDGGQATQAQFNLPFTVVSAGTSLYIADQANNRVRYVVASGAITTIAGNGTSGYTGDGGRADRAELNDPSGLAVDSSGNVYIADTNNHVIRKVTSGGVISTVAGNNTAGYGGDGGGAVGAMLFRPIGVALDGSGNLFIADTGNDVIRKVVLSSGIITTVVGNGNQGFYGDSGPAVNAELNNPESVAVDAQGNLYIADTNNYRIRKVANGTITTVAGNGRAGYTGDGGVATKAELNNPKGVAVDANGNIFIADSFNERIRRVTVNGLITTIAGSGSGGYAGDGGPATMAQLTFPSGVSADAAGDVYIADNQNNVIRLLTPIAQPVPAINAGGVLSAGAFGAFTSVAPGSWIEIYGSNLSSDSRGWTNADFNGLNAPTSLGGTSVTIGGQSAFIDYISAGQVNAQVPSNVGTGSQQIVVTSAAGNSAPYAITVNAAQPGLFAPPSFNIGGKQYIGALFTDGVTYVLPPGTISGVSSRQAKPGDTIVLYGVGFGAVNPGVPAGQVVQQNDSLTSSLQIVFGQTPATLSYYGLAPAAVGLYQFNVIVPTITASDAVPLTFTLGGVSGTQALYIAVQN